MSSGLVTSTSLMVTGHDLRGGVALARRLPGAEAWAHLELDGFDGEDVSLRDVRQRHRLRWIIRLTSRHHARHAPQTCNATP